VDGVGSRLTGRADRRVILELRKAWRISKYKIHSITEPKLQQAEIHKDNIGMDLEVDQHD
jgi:hypothetical protein